MNYDDMTPKPTPPEEQRHTGLGRQLLIIACIAVVLVIAVLYVRGRNNSDSGEDANNALDPTQVAVTRAAAQAIELKTAPVQIESGPKVIEANGVVHFSPYSTINVSPRFTGKVSGVFVRVGDHVVEKQPLAEMLSSDAANAVDTERDDLQQLSLTKTAFDTARRQFQMGTPEVTAAESTYIQAQENTAYTKRMLDLTLEQNKIGGFTDKPLTDAQSAFKQAQTQLAQDQKDLALYQTQYDRAKKLFGYGDIAQADVEVAEDTFMKQNDAVSNDQEQLRIATITVDREQRAYNTRLYANQTVRQAESAYEQAVIQERAASTAVRMAKAALLHDLRQAEHDYQTAMADEHAARVVLSTFDNPTAEGEVIIKAPSAGVVTARNVNPGQLLDQTGQTPWQMFTIVNAKTVYLDTQIYEQDMPAIHVGEPVSASSDAMPDWKQVHGTVSYVSPGLDPTTHALSVRTDLENHGGFLKDGMYMHASIEVGTNSRYQARPIVPLTAVVHDGNNDYVFLKGRDKYIRRQVVLGEQHGEDQVLINKGLRGGEMIVTHGALYLGTGGTAAD